MDTQAIIASAKHETDIYRIILEVFGMDRAVFEAHDTLYRLPKEFHCLLKEDIHNRYKIAKEYFISMYINNIPDIEKYLVGGHISSDPINDHDIYK